MRDVVSDALAQQRHHARITMPRPQALSRMGHQTNGLPSPTGGKPRGFSVHEPLRPRCAPARACACVSVGALVGAVALLVVMLTTGGRQSFRQFSSSSAASGVTAAEARADDALRRPRTPHAHASVGEAGVEHDGADAGEAGGDHEIHAVNADPEDVEPEEEGAAEGDAPQECPPPPPAPACVCDAGPVAQQPQGSSDAAVTTQTETSVKPSPATESLAVGGALKGAGHMNIQQLTQIVQRVRSERAGALPCAEEAPVSCPQFRAAGRLRFFDVGGWPLVYDLIAQAGSVISMTVMPTALANDVSIAPHDFSWHHEFDLTLLQNAKFASLWLIDPMPDSFFTAKAGVEAEALRTTLATGPGAASRALQWLYESVMGSADGASSRAIAVRTDALPSSRMFSQTFVGSKRWLLGCAVPNEPPPATDATVYVNGRSSKDMQIDLFRVCLEGVSIPMLQARLPLPPRLAAALRPLPRCGSVDAAPRVDDCLRCSSANISTDSVRQLRVLQRSYDNMLGQLSMDRTRVTILRISVAGYEYELFSRLHAAFALRVAQKIDAMQSVLLSPDEEAQLIELRTCQLIVQSHPWMLRADVRAQAEIDLLDAITGMGFELIRTRALCITPRGQPAPCPDPRSESVGATAAGAVTWIATNEDAAWDGAETETMKALPIRRYLFMSRQYCSG